MDKCVVCKRNTAVWTKTDKKGPDGIDMYAVWRKHGFGAAVDSDQKKVLCNSCHNNLRFKMVSKEMQQ